MSENDRYKATLEYLEEAVRSYVSEVDGTSMHMRAARLFAEMRVPLKTARWILSHPGESLPDWLLQDWRDNASDEFKESFPFDEKERAKVEV